MGHQRKSCAGCLGLVLKLKADIFVFSCIPPRFYDEDNSGSIEMDEMSKVLGNIYLSEGLSQVSSAITL